MIPLTCHVCRTALRAEDAQAGGYVRCPTCLTALNVPAPVAAGQFSASATTTTIPQPGGARSGDSGKRYGFTCPYCSSRLEATVSMGGREGQCPTCDNSIVIPILDAYNRLIDPKTREVIKPDPHPVHAYAAAGERAPEIIRASDGIQQIRCPRCSTFSTISANNCKACGMPFTLEGTSLEAVGGKNSYSVAALVLGLIGLPGFCMFLPSILAIIFGLVGYRRATGDGGSSGKGMAISGIALGVIGCGLGFWYYSR